MKTLKSIVACWVFCLAIVFGIQNTSVAQCLTFSPNPGVATVTIEAYWAINGNNVNSPLNLATFQDTVTAGNSTVPPGTYLGWCVDATQNIVDGPESYLALMYSSCDPNLDSELVALGTKYGFSYPASDTTDTVATWHQVNYLLNHKLAGASYWDIQVALWSFVGGPNPFASSAASVADGFPPYSQANVTEMVASAQNNAAAWQAQCGDVTAVILPIYSPDAGGDFPVQLTIIEVPVPCPIGVGDTATIGFWHNKNGQALIDSLGGGPGSTALADDLALAFPYLYGPDSPNDLTGKPNTAVAALFLEFFSVTGQKTQAQILATALAAFVTDSALFGTTAAPYGFHISTGGIGADTFNVGSNGTAIGLVNNTSYTVLQLLQQANLMMQEGTFNANAFNIIFSDINQGGDIN